jgi:hypothetical protein
VPYSSGVLKAPKDWALGDARLGEAGDTFIFLYVWRMMRRRKKAIGRN